MLISANRRGLGFLSLMTGKTDLHALIERHSRDLDQELTAHRQRSHPPSAAKSFRKLTPPEAARLLNVSDSRLRQVAAETGLGEANGPRRSYTAQDVAQLRLVLEKGGRTPGRYVPIRRAGEAVQTIVTMNFKGGSGKTTTSAHLAQYLALRGYRVLAVDLDPQASLTALFGLHSVLDVPARRTIYGAIAFDGARAPLAELVTPTYLPGLSLVPGGLEIMEFEHEMPRALLERRGDDGIYFDRVLRALQSVAEDYDVIVVDCPPQLGYLGLSALVAATAVLITVHPQMLDVMSMSQFLAMTRDLLGVVIDVMPQGERPTYDWMRYLLTRFEPHDGPQNQMASFLRGIVGEHVLLNATLKSTAISDAGLTNQTIYEVERTQFTRATYDRAVESVDAVNREIEELILKAWGRK